MFLLAVSCSSAVADVDNARVVESYNIIGGFVSYTCDSEHAFPAGGHTRISMCQETGAWGEPVESCTSKPAHVTSSSVGAAVRSADVYKLYMYMCR